MNRSAQRKILIILFVLLFLSLSGLGYWYFFMYRCGVLPQGYEFLDRFVVRNECREREYEVKGIMYNIREEESNIVFDFNAWDTESRESLYYENIQVSKDILTGDFEVISDNFGAVGLNVRFEKEIFTLKEYNLQNLNVDELKLTEEKYNEAFNTVYIAITKSPLVEEIYQSIEFYGFNPDEVNATFTEVRNHSLFDDPPNSKYPYEYLPELQNGLKNKLLYRPWILSYLYYIDKDNSLYTREEIIEMLLFDINEHKEKVGSLVPEEKREVLCQVPADSNPEQEYTTEETNDYVSKNSFACLMMYQISENLDLNDRDVFNKHCDVGLFEESVSNHLKGLEVMDTQSAYIRYSDILDSKIFLIGKEGRDISFYSSNTASILADTYGSRKLYGKNLEEDLEIRTREILDYVLTYGVPYLENICSVSYFSNLIQSEGETNFNNNEGIQEITRNTNDLFAPGSKEIFNLMDEDLYSSILCLEAGSIPEDRSIETLLKIQIQKILNLNLYSDNEMVGIWENKEYDIRTNARFLKLLLLNKDLLL